MSKGKKKVVGPDGEVTDANTFNMLNSDGSYSEEAKRGYAELDEQGMSTERKILEYLHKKMGAVILITEPTEEAIKKNPKYCGVLMCKLGTGAVDNNESKVKLSMMIASMLYSAGYDTHDVIDFFRKGMEAAELTQFEKEVRQSHPEPSSEKEEKKLVKDLENRISLFHLSQRAMHRLRKLWWDCPDPLLQLFVPSAAKKGFNDFVHDYTEVVKKIADENGGGYDPFHDVMVHDGGKTIKELVHEHCLLDDEDREDTEALKKIITGEGFDED